MKKFFKFSYPIFLTLIVCVSAYAQETKVISAGIVNGKALSMPTPQYSGNIFKLGAPGKIEVKVLIDEKGDVISAETVYGIEDLSLRKACEAAAMKAKFSPTLLSGRPVKVSGVIVYNFVDARTNEAKLKVLAVSTFIAITRSVSSDDSALSLVFEDSEVFDIKSPEFSDFTAELAPFLKLKDVSEQERVEIIENAASLIAKKLNKPELWQFELGKHLGGIMGVFFHFQAASGQTPDINKFNKIAAKDHLLEIKNLLNSAPADFPADVKEKLITLTMSSESKTYDNKDDISEIIENIMSLLNTISPDLSNDSTN